MEKYGYTFLQSMLLDEAVNYRVPCKNSNLDTFPKARLVGNAMEKSPQSVNPTCY